MAKRVRKDMLIIEALDVDPDVAGILMSEGMHCIYCGAASGETLEEAGYVHGFSSEDMQALVDSINAYLDEKEANAAAQG